MKNLIVILIGLLLTVTSVMAETVYRPYASCTSPNQNTTIEIMQNMDRTDVLNPYRVSVIRAVRGHKISFTNHNAVKIPVHRKDVLEVFQSYGNKPTHAFELWVTTTSPLTMTGQYKAYYVDVLGRSVVYCSHHVTFGN